MIYFIPPKINQHVHVHSALHSLSVLMTCNLLFDNKRKQIDCYLPSFRRLIMYEFEEKTVCRQIDRTGGEKERERRAVRLYPVL